MLSEEALRAAKRLFRGEAWMTTQQIERAAEIIDAEFAALRDRAEALERQVNDLLGNEVHLAEAEIERDKLRAALGRRGRADCPKCGGSGQCDGKYVHDDLAGLRGECECRKELGL